jgi:predicted kinase
MVIAVTGLPGSGKTTFAKALAARINGKHISSDDVRFKKGHRGRYDANTKLRVYDLMMAEMEEALQAGHHVVLDATFYKEAIRRSFKDITTAYNRPFYLIKIEASEAVTKERMAKQRIDSEADFQAYLLVKSEYEPIKEEYLTLYSDRDQLADMVNQALPFIAYCDEKS